MSMTLLEHTTISTIMCITTTCIINSNNRQYLHNRFIVLFMTGFTLPSLLRPV